MNDRLFTTGNMTKEARPQIALAPRLRRFIRVLICSGDAIIRIAGATTRPANEPAISPIKPEVIGTSLPGGAGGFACAQNRMNRRGYLGLTCHHIGGAA